MTEPERKYLEACRDRLLLPKSKSLEQRQRELGLDLTRERRHELAEQAFALENGMVTH